MLQKVKWMQSIAYYYIHEGNGIVHIDKWWMMRRVEWFQNESGRKGRNVSKMNKKISKILPKVSESAEQKTKHFEFLAGLCNLCSSIANMI